MGKKVMVFLLISYTVMADMNTIYARKEKYKCEKLFMFYKIDRITKSYKGWLRVCKNDKLHLYSVKKYINKKDKELLCNCFKDNYKTRDIEDIRSNR